MTSDDSRKLRLALIVNAGTVAAKLFAAASTGSVAMMAQTVQGLVDTSSQGLVAVAPDARSSTTFWSLCGGLLLAALGAGVALDAGIDKLLHPQPIADPKIAYFVLAGSFVLTTLLLRHTAQGADGTSAVRFALTVQHTTSLCGIVAALVGVAASDLLSIPWADGAASITIGLVLTVGAALLALEIRRLLNGAAAQAAVADMPRAISPAEIATTASPVATSAPEPAAVKAAVPTARPPVSNKGKRKKHRR